MRSPVNRRDPSGTKRIEREEIARQSAIIRAYAEAMARVASGEEEGASAPWLDDEGRVSKLERLREAMKDDLTASVDDWINKSSEAAVRTTDKVLNNMHTGIQLGNVPIPREEVSMLRTNILANVSTIPESLFTDVTRLATQAYQEGWGVKETARKMTDLGEVKRSDAERIIRTETMRVVDVVSKVRYQAAGCDGYMSYPTDDDRLCDHCLRMATGGSGTALKIYDPSEPMSLPWHPNCRCTRLPHFADDTEVYTI